MSCTYYNSYLYIQSIIACGILGVLGLLLVYYPLAF